MSKYLKPRKYWEKFCYERERHIQRKWEAVYDVDQILKDECEKFTRMGLDYHRGVERLNETLKRLEMPAFSENVSMASIHWVLFAAVSEAMEVKRFLEIGTFNGMTTRVIAELFPDCQVTTVDLPADDPIFSTTYNRDEEEQREKFRQTQAANVDHPRITFMQHNSFFLPSVTSDEEKFDVIWVDGGHRYPEVAWDVCNAWHLCREGGWLLLDDVVPPSARAKNEYAGPEVWDVYDYVLARTGEKAEEFLKRHAPEWSANPINRKYVVGWRRSHAVPTTTGSA